MALAYPSFRTVEPLSPYLPENLRQGLVLYLWMNEGAGNTVYDLSGNGNHGTIYGATWTRLASGKNALYFDGVDDYVGVPNTRTLLYGVTELTMASWVKHSAVPSGWRNVVSKGSDPLCIQHSGGGNYFEFAIQTSTGRTYIFSTTRTDLNVGKWFHVVAVWKSPTMYLYVNGVLESTGTRDGVFVDTTYDFNIGRASEGTRYFPGFISCVLIYNRALSDAEIRTLYNLHRGLFVG
ncbi:MAG: LamG domain-containing protein [Pyrobaculum sp.]|uniref:LamG domain-containing protein n=1 Tax=Pyrobaculum sp. TaxID=2004705 RepID=UPI003175DD68